MWRQVDVVFYRVLSRKVLEFYNMTNQDITTHCCTILRLQNGAWRKTKPVFLQAIEWKSQVDARTHGRNVSSEILIVLCGVWASCTNQSFVTNISITADAIWLEWNSRNTIFYALRGSLSIYLFIYLFGCPKNAFSMKLFWDVIVAAWVYPEDRSVIIWEQFSALSSVAPQFVRTLQIDFNTTAWRPFWRLKQNARFERPLNTTRIDEASRSNDARVDVPIAGGRQ